MITLIFGIMLFLLAIGALVVYAIAATVALVKMAARLHRRRREAEELIIHVGPISEKES